MKCMFVSCQVLSIVFRNRLNLISIHEFYFHFRREVPVSSFDMQFPFPAVACSTHLQGCFVIQKKGIRNPFVGSISIVIGDAIRHNVYHLCDKFDLCYNHFFNFKVYIYSYATLFTS